MQIRFRAWHHDLKVMLYPPSRLSSSFNAEPRTVIIIPEHESILERDFNGNPWIIEKQEIPIQAKMLWDGRVYVAGKLQNVTLQQFTGLVDINGRKIYIGDIVQYNNKSSYDGQNCYVVANEYTLGFTIQCAGDELLNSVVINKNGGASLRYNLLEVVGNIFENPVDNSNP